MSVDHHHHQADSLYRPLEGVAAWPGSVMDWAGWESGIACLNDLRRLAPELMAMIERGTLVAAAYQSGALDGLYNSDDQLAARLVDGRAGLADIESVTSEGVNMVDHVQANMVAMESASPAGTDRASQEVVTQHGVRRLHQLACAPQVTHRVPTALGTQDHVLAHGDYKHHANHRRTADGTWLATVPIAMLGDEMVRLVTMLDGDDFQTLHPVVRSAFSLHAISHVAPFADGNGRVARVMASSHLRAATGLPLLVGDEDGPGYATAIIEADQGRPNALVGFVEQLWLKLVDAISHTVAIADASPEYATALARWNGRRRQAEVLAGSLVEGVEAAVARHRERTDLRWLSRLDGAVVYTPLGALAIHLAVDVDGKKPIEERLIVDAHPPLGDARAVQLTAEEAQLALEVRPTEAAAPLDDGLAAWLDRVVSALALRAAAGAG